MKKIIDLADDFIAGHCFDCNGTALCPFASKGCWVHDPAKCPLLNVKNAVDVTQEFLKIVKGARLMSPDFGPGQAKEIEVYEVEK